MDRPSWCIFAVTFSLLLVNCNGSGSNSDSESSCLMEEGIDYPGADINEATITRDKRDSPQACRILCQQTSNCEFFTWTKERHCWMKSRVTRKKRETGVTSGSACRVKRRQVSAWNSCCPQGFKLSLETVRSGGYSASCIKSTMRDGAAVQLPGLRGEGHNLPQCTRGMKVELVETKESNIAHQTTRQSGEVEEFFNSPYEKTWTDSQCSMVGWGPMNGNLEECINSCIRKPSCTAVNFAYDDCVHRSCRTPVPEPALRIYKYKGYKVLNRKDCLPNIIEDTSHSGNDLPNMPIHAKTPDECFQLCRNYIIDYGLLCVGMTFREMDETCWLHDKIYDSKLGYSHHRYFARNEDCNSSTTTIPQKTVLQKEYSSTQGLPGFSDSFHNGDFCLETNSEAIEDIQEKNIELKDENHVQALELTCNFCKEQVFCHYLEVFYASVLDNRIIQQFPKLFNSFEEFKTIVENFIRNIWEMVDLDKDGTINEILKQSEVRVSSNFILKMTLNLFDQIDLDGDGILTGDDWVKLIGQTKNVQSIGRRLILLPAPVFNLYTSIDEDKNEELSLKEIENFIKRTFTIIDENQDCLIDFTEILSTLDKCKLVKDFQLGLKLLADHHLLVWNQFLNRIVESADSNEDNRTEVDEILNLSDFNVIESKIKNLIFLAQPDEKLINYLSRESSSYAEEDVRGIWLEALQHLIMNEVYQTDLTSFKCG